MIKKVRGEGMVFGIECGPVAGLTANQVANKVVEACYVGKPGGDGIHFLGPLAGCVLRVAPPLTMTAEEAEASLDLLFSLVSELEAGCGGQGRPSPEIAGRDRPRHRVPLFHDISQFPIDPKFRFAT